MLLSYKAKKNKVVYLLSSQHKTPSIAASNLKQKPDAILYYNSEKGGVDTADEELRGYSTKAASRRWPLACFFNLLDIVCLNSYIICKDAKVDEQQKRRGFLISQGELLCASERTRRKPLPHTFHLHATASAAEVDLPSGKRTTCRKCQKNKTRTRCKNCGVYVCGTCSKWVCNACCK